MCHNIRVQNAGGSNQSTPAAGDYLGRSESIYNLSQAALLKVSRTDHRNIGPASVTSVENETYSGDHTYSNVAGACLGRDYSFESEEGLSNSRGAARALGSPLTRDRDYFTAELRDMNQDNWSNEDNRGEKEKGADRRHKNRYDRPL